MHMHTKTRTHTQARDWLKHGKIKIVDVEEVQEGVEYYVESHMDLDFVEVLPPLPFAIDTKTLINIIFKNGKKKN
jgi:hypothetical protein